MRLKKKFSISTDEEAVAGLAFIKGIVEGKESLARVLIDAREDISLALYSVSVKWDAGNYTALLSYACQVPTHRKRTKMEVDRMVETWFPLIVKLAVAHDVDEKDAASAELDEHLMSVIAAPIGQIRDFYRKLTGRLKADPSVPWAVWRLWEAWGETVLDKISREEIIGLKKELAERIADRTMQDIPLSDWRESMVNALQWRSPEKLEEVNAALSSGAKPRVRGRQSCLFLELEKPDGQLQAQVML